MSLKKEISNSTESKDLILLSDILPDKLIILPVDNPIFPGSNAPLIISGKEYIDALKIVSKTEPKIIGVCLAKKFNHYNIFDSELYSEGTAIKVSKAEIIDDETVQIYVKGLNRFKLIKEVSKKPILKWQVKYHYESNQKNDEEIKAYTLAIFNSAKEILKINPVFKEQINLMFSNMKDAKPGYIFDLITSLLNLDSHKQQKVLSAFDLNDRANELLVLIKEEIEFLKIQEKIKKQIDEKISKQQHNFFLNEQLKIIKKELGLEKDEKSLGIQKIELQMKQLNLSFEVKKILNSELSRLKLLEVNSSEFNIIKNYLDTLVSLPWGIYSKDKLNIKNARKILNRYHYGLDDIKQRILEFISTIIKRGKLTGSNILLVGPPGVGKTSIGKSIAKALGREFYRFSVGGIRDESEIKGHRRTYIGAMPGKIIEALKRVKTSNPVIMIDEIDKLVKSNIGDPSSSLLEVLDPEQNKEFLDHYIDVSFDISNVLFIATANQLDTISKPLLDRMEVISLSGYILEEKVQIAKKYLIPKQLTEHGLDKKEIKITKKTIEKIIDSYSREAGVRGLENQIKKIMRKSTLMQIENNLKQINIENKNLSYFLGKEKFSTEKLYNKNKAGVVLGLAYTNLGGSTLYVEANCLESKRAGFKQTGQLGKIMQESAEIAYSYISSFLSSKKEYKEFFDKNLIHLHVPEGATPKDGPSAGVTMALALYSLITKKPIKSNIAMSGEITLTGKILAVGGIKEKIIAAKRVKINQLILPKENERDFIELPEYIKSNIKVNYINSFEEIISELTIL